MTNIPSVKQSVLNPALKPTGRPPSAQKNHTNSTITSILVTFILFVMLFAVAFIIANSATNKPKPPTTYEECIKSKGSVIRESYPAVCVAKNGSEFIQPLSDEGQFCGGFAGVACPTGFRCQLDGDYPDAGGTCVKN